MFLFVSDLNLSDPWNYVHVVIPTRRRWRGTLQMALARWPVRGSWFRPFVRPSQLFVRNSSFSFVAVAAPTKEVLMFFATTQALISLRICAGCSWSSLSAYRVNCTVAYVTDKPSFSFFLCLLVIWSMIFIAILEIICMLDGFLQCLIGKFTLWDWLYAVTLWIYHWYTLRGRQLKTFMLPFWKWFSSILQSFLNGVWCADKQKVTQFVSRGREYEKSDEVYKAQLTG